MSIHVGESYKEYPVYVVQEDVPVATKITFAPGIKEVLICTGFWLESVKFEGKDTKVAFNFCIPDNFPVKVKEVIFPENLTEFGGFKYYKDFNEKRGTNIFENCSTLTNVRLPKKLRKIGPNMFKKCTGLTSIDIPESVKVIGYSAFEKCTNLVFPDGLPFLSQLDTLGNAAFAWCGFNMENVTIPKNLKKLHLNSFQACNITNLKVEEGVEEVGLGNAFIKNITLPKSVHTLYGEMTSNTETFIVHPDAPITELPRKAFYNHKTLKKVQLPKALQTIGLEAFRMCENLADINLEETSLKTIDCMAFDYCNALQHVVLPNTVETIEDGAFMECI